VLAETFGPPPRWGRETRAERGGGGGAVARPSRPWWSGASRQVCGGYGLGGAPHRARAYRTAGRPMAEAHVLKPPDRRGCVWTIVSPIILHLPDVPAQGRISCSSPMLDDGGPRSLCFY